MPAKPPEPEASGSYSVGYRRPPKATQFKKGQSGNPHGRARRTRNLKTELLEEISERIPIREHGVAKTVSKLRATLKSLVARAMQGDPRATSLLINKVADLVEDEPLGKPERIDLADEDKEIIEEFLRRHPPATEEPTDSN